MSKQIFYTTLGSKFNNPDALYVELVFDQTIEGSISTHAGYINAMKIIEYE